METACEIKKNIVENIWVLISFFYKNTHLENSEEIEITEMCKGDNL